MAVYTYGKRWSPIKGSYYSHSGNIFIKVTKKELRGSYERKGRRHRDEEEKSKQQSKRHKRRKDCTCEGEEEWVEPNKTRGKRYA